jgi:hypothetical protein
MTKLREIIATSGEESGEPSQLGQIISPEPESDWQVARPEVITERTPESREGPKGDWFIPSDEFWLDPFDESSR